LEEGSLDCLGLVGYEVNEVLVCWTEQLACMVLRAHQ
jgi:hypothetical protein